MTFLLKNSSLIDSSPQSLVPSMAAFVHVTNETQRPEEFVDEIRVTIRTGNDNLEDDNKAFVEILNSTNGQLLNFRLNEGGVEFPNNTVNTFNRVLGSPTSINQIKKIRIRHTAENCTFCTADNWNIDRLIVDVKINGAWRNLKDLSGNPLIRLTGTYKSWETIL